MKQVRLHGYWRSSASWRVRIALNLKGIPFESLPVHLVKDGGQQHQPAYRAVNPMGRVPTLEWTDDGGQERRLSESMAILEYLEERGGSPALLPSEAYLRARTRMLAEMVNAGIQPLQNTSVVLRVRDVLKGDEKAWGAHWNAHGLTALETAVQATVGRYCVGDAVSFADILLVPQLYGARRLGVDLTPYPTLLRIEAACNELPAFQAAQPDRQPDAQPA
ncbi:maleylacetoacetate isomerase [Corallococcus sp. ZKHCc1 1396]|uniref:Maleylacetoacetate isomerase n=1 Tax=Corallococcus soli TaxID=2710757 RepID=A0ABR9PRN1_9BACT|nr:maleylacetoacetate isomerase [Corallococcus soli]MBE4750568.1 maleylacetoacetate isomerase [Corallococcus soli]